MQIIKDIQIDETLRMLPRGIMITENEVVDMVISKLQELGYRIVSSCDTNTKGVDIVAEKNNKKLLIEAKGGTTSKESAKEGRPFDRNQAKTHISVAIFKLLQLKEKNRDALLAMALPCERHHFEFIDSIKTSVRELEIVIFWCNKERTIIQGKNLV